MARLKLATYNINGIRARLGALLEWLECEQPDIVCLQELKAPDEAFPLADIEALGYGAIWQGQKSWNGIAILARGAQPHERRRGLPGGADDEQSRYLEAEVHGLVVGCLYLPNGNPWPGPKFDYKLAWFDRFNRHARALLREGMPTVLAGDFNVVPTDELDIYDPKSWSKDALLQPESREAYFELLGQGWTDSLRTIAGNTKVFTFWDYFRKHWERDAGLRIDHLLLSPDLSVMLANAGVDRWVRGRPGASDHAPTWVLLDAGGRGATAGSAERAGSKALRPKTSRGQADAGSVPRGDAAKSPTGKSRAAKKARTSAVADPTKTTAAKKRPARKAPAAKASAAHPPKRAAKQQTAKKSASTRSAKTSATKATTSKRAVPRPPAPRTSASKRRPDA